MFDANIPGSERISVVLDEDWHNSTHPEFEIFGRHCVKGTDGARLSYMNLPCPNLFAGGEAIHSTLEWVPVQVMDKAAETIVHLSAIWAEESL